LYIIILFFRDNILTTGKINVRIFIFSGDETQLPFLLKILVILKTIFYIYRALKIGGMETLTEQNEQLKTFLNEAMDLLDDIKDKLGMFQTQRYYRLKRDVEKVEEVCS
jgi:hypothetical protein